MTPETVMDLAHSTLIVTSMVAAPLLLIALVAHIWLIPQRVRSRYAAITR